MESIKNLQAFLAIVEARSFTDAANKLFITPVGKSLIPYATNLIDAWNNIQRKVESLKYDVSGELKISCNYQISIDFLPKILKLYVQKYPKVDIKIDSTCSLPIIKKLMSLILILV
ncbi:LysR family transcriptional regulator [Francisella sp. SYW-9]|uniref:LysR family transcriptional regulator n=1 Tax=Francisella sp. SYW-9 TaxID=2610888 RepID=UPI00123D73DB|nr:LysR family transcriptional regulator [Francisella sp. SYW-9]